MRGQGWESGKKRERERETNFSFVFFLHFLTKERVMRFLKVQPQPKLTVVIKVRRWGINDKGGVGEPTKEKQFDSDDKKICEKFCSGDPDLPNSKRKSDIQS